ncbi:MAG: SRPBCC family protein [Proteobacteria bacterium]|nr:SRPBCC family protein [Pseudomonadota bacterium]
MTIAPVRRTVTVNVSQAKAFEVFTARLDAWWPKSHHIGGAPLKSSAIEPRVGGRWYTVHEDGSECTVGTVSVWDPPNRLVHSWDINAMWKSDATVASEVEVRFIAEGSSRTRVELEHRNFERLGAEGGEAMRAAIDGSGGWSAILELYRQDAEAA